MMWAQARGTEPPPEVRGVLDMLVGVAEPYERGSRWPLTPPDGHAGAEYWMARARHCSSPERCSVIRPSDRHLV
jgi:hypothetical protein